MAKELNDLLSYCGNHAEGRGRQFSNSDLLKCPYCGMFLVNWQSNKESWQIVHARWKKINGIV